MVKLSIILVYWRKSNISLPLFPKTHYKLGLVASLTWKWKISIVQVKRRFSTQLGEINSLAFMTESSFIGFCLENKNKFEQKYGFLSLVPELSVAAVAAPKWQMEGYVCNKQRTIPTGERKVVVVAVAYSSGCPDSSAGSARDKQLAHSQPD